MHDGVLYVSTAWSMVKAYDAKTGELKWSYDPKVPRETLAAACCDAVNRGVALYGDKVYVATLNGDLVALNQATARSPGASTVVPNPVNYTITGAPRVANGRILIGIGGAEYRAARLSGRLRLADRRANCGASIPCPAIPARATRARWKAAATWGGEWWKLGGGGTVWDSITFDPGNQPDPVRHRQCRAVEPRRAELRMNEDDRSGDNLYTWSIVAVDADTGEYKWHFQETPEDRWDYNSNAQITIATMTIGGAERRVAIHVPKNGYVYVLDAATGEFLSGTPRGRRRTGPWGSTPKPVDQTSTRRHDTTRPASCGSRSPARAGRAAGRR